MVITLVSTKVLLKFQLEYPVFWGANANGSMFDPNDKDQRPEIKL